MATTSYEYPFVNFDEEIFPRVPGAHVANDINSIKPSFPIGKDRLVDVIGEDVWKLMIDHYNDTDNYNQSEQANSVYLRLDKLVSKCQDAMIQFVYYEHFIFLMLHINDTGITVIKNTEETTAYKYLTDEAKDKFIENAWTYTSMLLKFLNDEATRYTTWVKATDYTINQVVKNGTQYYRAVDTHTSGDTFAGDAAHWTEIPKSVTFTNWAAQTEYIQDQTVTYSGKYYKAKAGFTSGDNFVAENWDEVAEPSEVVFWQWTESTEYIDSKNLIFTNYKDFNKYYLIDNSAYFYHKIRNLINGVINDEVSTRLETLEALKTELQENNVSTDHTLILNYMKYATAYLVMSKAVVQFSYFEFPRALRYDFSNEMSRNSNAKNNSDFFRKNLSAMFQEKADQYWYKFEEAIKLQTELEEDPHTEDYEVETEKYDQDEDDKFVSMM